MKMTNDEYKDYSERHMPSSPLLPDMLKAFAVGGLICCIGQLIGDLYLDAGLGKTAAATAASVTLVFIGALLTGLGVYDRIAVFAEKFHFSPGIQQLKYSCKYIQPRNDSVLLTDQLYFSSHSLFHNRIRRNIFA